MASDEDLMADIVGGSADAFAELLDRYRRPLAGYLRRRCIDTAGVDAEDLFQDVWLRVVRSAESFDARRRFRPWLYRIAQNVLHDLARRRPARAELTDVDMAAAPVAREGAGVDAERLLAAISDAQRDVVMLRYYAELSEAEIGEALDIPRGTVKSRLHTAMARMAEIAGENEEAT